MLWCRYIVHPDNRLTLRAQVEIKAGEEVTMIVLSYQCIITIVPYPGDHPVHLLPVWQLQAVS